MKAGNGFGKPYGKFFQQSICLFVLVIILGMFQPEIHRTQPVYADAPSPGFGSGNLQETGVVAEKKKAVGVSSATVTSATYSFSFELFSENTIIDLSDNNPSDSGTGWTYEDNVYTILNGANVTVVGTSSNQRRIEVAENAKATITLSNVTITGLGDSQSPLLLNSGADVTLILADGTTNTLTAGKLRAGIQVPAGTKLTIDGTGSLTATGNYYGAGIGGGALSDSGSIIIDGGTVTAQGGLYGAGIGGGWNGRGSVIINGGTVTATGGNNGAGIGSGYCNLETGKDAGSIIINGGTVTATGGYLGAGIGGGQHGRGGSVTITGGTVIAKAGNYAVAIGRGSDTGASNGTLDMNGYKNYEYWTNSIADETGAEPGTVYPLVLNDNYKYIKIAPDATPPTPGDGGAITTSDVTHDSLALHWTAASDNTSKAEDLKYYVYQSTSSMSGITPDGVLLNTGGTVNITTYSVTGLSPNSKYYFIVVVEDETGNKSAYTAVEVTTDLQDPVVHWPTNLTAIYGQTLAEIPLPGNGTGTPGTFAWTKDGSAIVGHVGTRTFNLTFTPNDPETYKTVTQDVYVEVLPKSLTADMLAVQGGPFTYNGTAHTPSIAVTDGSTVLVPDIDYENVVYSSNTNAGTATVSITGKGNYTGTVSQNFRIAPASLTLKADDVTIVVGEPEPAYTYTVSGLVGSDTEEEVILDPPVLGVPGFSSAMPATFEIVISGGTANGNYTIDNRVNGTLTVVAANGGGGSPGSDDEGPGNDDESPGIGGESSPDGSSFSVIIFPPSPDQPDAPTKAVIRIPGTVDDNGSIIVNISDRAASHAFEMALADARSRGYEQYGIMLVFDVDTGSEAGSRIAVHLSKAVQELIIARRIASTVVVADHPDLPVEIGMDLGVVEEIYRQANSDVTVTAAPIDVTKLSREAQDAVGSRPVFDLRVNDGSGSQVQNFGNGRITVTIPYILGEKEKAGNIRAVFIDEDGRVHWLNDSVYDVENQVLRFSTNHFSLFGVGYREEVPAPAFADIENHWAKEDIEFVARQGLFRGTSETTFSPDMAMTRGMFVTVIGRLTQADISGYTESSFADVPGDAYYMGYIEWARSHNIINGVGNGRFAPDQSITREQMAVILLNYANAIGFTLPKVHEENIFADNDQISAYARDAVAQMQMAGIINGKTGNVFDPQGTATRAEVSAVLRRFAEMVISDDPYSLWDSVVKE